MFKKYMHLERLGSNEVDGITTGSVTVFPKLDGTNASVWLDKETNTIKGGSRNRELEISKDNAGFYNWVIENNVPFKEYLEKYPNRTLYGEWLVPHSLKTYRDDSWRHFYIFDVLEQDDENDIYRFIPYDEYCVELKDMGFDYIVPIGKVINGSDETFRKLTEKNTFLIKDGEGVGEGVVLKNYDFVNKYGRIVWAKIVTNEFKEKHAKEMGTGVIGGLALEEKIVDNFLTKEMIIKTHSKIVNDNSGEWNSKMVPKLLGLVWHDFVVEEIWDIVKKYKHPKIDFAFLNRMVIQKIKKETENFSKFD